MPVVKGTGARDAEMVGVAELDDVPEADSEAFELLVKDAVALVVPVAWLLVVGAEDSVGMEDAVERAVEVPDVVAVSDAVGVPVHELDVVPEPDAEPVAVTDEDTVETAVPEPVELPLPL